MLSSKMIAFISLITSILLFGYFGYFLDRSQTIKLLCLISFLFIAFAYVYKTDALSFRQKSIFGILCRFIFILAMPNLSQDFYRFLWDGSLLLQGINPYLHLPDQLITLSKETVHNQELLYQKMGSLSSGHYSNYPPINQLFFGIAAFFAKYSFILGIIVLHLIMLVADLGILYFGKRILQKIKLPKSYILLYFLNPFIIIELNGNLHFEGVMLFFMIWSFYLLLYKKLQWAALIYALSIGVKLIPLLFLPLFWNYLPWKKTMAFYTICMLSVLVFFFPFIDLEFIQNYQATISLWFVNFEFNASIYYIIREIGYAIYGYNIIHYIGKIMPVFTIVFVLYCSFCKKNSSLTLLIKNMLFVYTFYLLLSTTIHPWYLSTLVVLSVFSQLRFPIVWSFVVFLSYSAYSLPVFEENLYLVGVEYLCVIAFIVYEVLGFDRDAKTSSLVESTS